MLSEEFITSIKQAFDGVDKDGDGCLTSQEMLEAFRSMVYNIIFILYTAFCFLFSINSCFIYLLIFMVFRVNLSLVMS